MSELKQRLYIAGNIGLDLSPGDPLALDALHEIERLERGLAELYALLGSVRGEYEQIEAHNTALRDAIAALSPDAGRRVLDVVEAVKEWAEKKDFSETTERIDLERRILKALAAMEGK